MRGAPRSGSGDAVPPRWICGSVRPELPERTVTMSFPIGPTQSQNRNGAPSSRRTAADPERLRLRPPAAGCPGEREGWWRRRTLSWRTSSGAPVVSLLPGWGGGGSGVLATRTRTLAGSRFRSWSGGRTGLTFCAYF